MPDMAPFPLIKLGYLAVKQISKPIANYIKRKAKSTPLFRKYICMPPAQFYHWAEVNFKMRLLGLGSAGNVEKLSEKEAIELGGEMLGEFVVFFMAAVVVVAEYARSVRKEAAKEEALQKDKLVVVSKLSELETIVGIQESQIRGLQNQLDVVSEQQKLYEGNQLAVCEKLLGRKH